MNHRPRKRFGQNFLNDHSVIDRIVDAIDPQPEDTIVEIGPGRGALTRPLLESGAALEAIELDRDLVAYWRSQALDHLTVHEGDALRFDFPAHYAAPVRLVGNLPYNVSTPLLFHFRQHRQSFVDLHVMLQREVAERICADPGSKVYGRLTVMLAVMFDTELLFDVAPDAFEPPPKVTSSVLRMTPRADETGILDDAVFEHLVRQAFSMRRKTLRKSLQSLCTSQDLEACDIDPGLRPERLSAATFVQLANHLSART